MLYSNVQTANTSVQQRSEKNLITLAVIYANKRGKFIEQFYFLFSKNMLSNYLNNIFVNNVTELKRSRVLD